MNTLWPNGAAPLISVFGALRAIVRIVAAAAVLAVCGLPAFAQETWTAATSPTTQDLWGICYAKEQFVAVGAGGTVLTSSDGLAWTAQPSGTAEWLLAVAYGDGQFVAVGDHGTILTSPDAVSWTARSRGGARLNGVVFGAGRFLAVGGNGAAVWSADAGVSWTPATTGVTVFLRGVVHDGTQFIVAGGSNTILASRDGVAFHRRSSNNSGTDVEALAFSSGDYLGAGGPGAGATRDSRYWDEFVYLHEKYFRGAAFAWGTCVVVGANADGTAAVAYRRPGGYWAVAPLGGGRGLNAVTSAPTTAVAVGRSGTILRASADPADVAAEIVGAPVAPLPGETATLFARASGAPPLRYQWYRDDRPIAGATEAQLVFAAATPADTASYKVEVTSGAVTRSAEFRLTVISLGAAAQVVDRSFAPDLPPDTELIGQMPDGRPWVSSSWDFYVGDEPVGNYAAVNADGSISAAPSPWTAERFSSVPLADGRRLRVELTGAADRVLFTRWSADGTQDLGYGTLEVAVPELAAESYAHNGLTFGSVCAARDSVGDSLVVVNANGWWDRSWAAILKVNRDGVPVAGWIPKTMALSIGQLASTGSAYRYVGLEVEGPHNSSVTVRIAGLTQQGTADPDYSEHIFAPTMAPRQAIMDQDGSAYVVESGYVVRFDSNGIRDSSYFAPIPAGVSSMVRMSDGSLILDGERLWRTVPVTNAAPTRLVNLSIRTMAGAGDQTLIAGFVTAGGTGTRSLLLRAIGPGLAGVGVNAAGAIADPRLTLYSRGNPVATNDDWSPGLSSLFQSLGAFPLPEGSRDAALQAELGRGVYTAHVGSADGSPGMALLELYDAEPASAVGKPSLVNISGRAHVGTGDGVLIAGFVIDGKNPLRLLVRGIGPGLARQGVTDAVAQPILEIRRGATLLETNGSWSDRVSADDFATVGAFALDARSHDAAIVRDFEPGVYTALVRGEYDTTGTALIEIYVMPQP